MNLRPGYLATLFLLLFAFSSVNAQVVTELVTIKNESISFEVQSRFEPYLGQSPSDGDVEIEEGATFNYTVTYTPDPGFVGDDGMLLVSFPFDQSIAFEQYEIQVLEAFVKANHDFAATASNTAVTISPLLNDSTNIGELQVTGVPVVNAGSAEVIDNQIVFTPNPGFSGLTDLNYTICTDGNACALGTISINVAPEPGTSSSDTVRVFTTRENAQFIFAPEDAVALAEPEFGDVLMHDGVMAYQPHEGFVGDEYLSYSLPQSGVTTVFHVTVLDLQPNQFAVEDRQYTPINTSQTFNVLYNDLYSVFADCVTFGAPRYGTITEDVPNGQVTYTPPENWSGVDQFTYSSKAFNCEGEAELATVYIFVSNFSPADNETKITVPEGAATELTYDIPGGNASWSVVDQPAFGVVSTNPVTGKINYQSNAGTSGQEDAFTLAYCLNEDENGDCQFSTLVEVEVAITAADPNACIDEDCVWPGDTNNDGVVDVGDLLPIGLAMGQTGVPRVGGSESWSPQYAEDWSDDLNGLNLKYVDADGDQVISAADTAVVMANIGLGHRLRAEVQNFTSFQMSLIGPTVVEPGDLIVLDLIAGANAVIVEDVYGIRWPFVYDNNIVDPSSVGIDFGEDSWLSYDSPIIGVSINNQENGLLEAAVTRTNGEGISGFGSIATLNAVIVEDVYGIRPDGGDPIEADESFTVTFGGGEGAAVMSANGYMDAVTVNPLTVTVNPQPATDVAAFTPDAAQLYLDGKLIAYPNPTGGNLTVHLNGQQMFSALQVTDMTGRVLISEQGLNTNHRDISLAQMPNGIYTLTITTEAGVVNRKVEVLR